MEQYNNIPDSFEENKSKMLNAELESLIVLDEADINENRATDLYTLGVRFELLGDNAKSAGCFLKSAEIYSTLNCYLKAASAFKRAGEDALAEEMYAEAAEKEKENGDFKLASNYYGLAGKPEEADEMRRKKK